MKKGFTLLEILSVLVILMIVLGITGIIIKPHLIFQRTRDLKRISDLNALEIAIKTYISATNTPILGPDDEGYGETNQKIFISVPFDKEDKRNLNVSGFSIYQVSSTNLLKIDGNGWLPINFSVLVYPPIHSLPIDPLNSYNLKYFYSYVFKRASSTFEINANLEYERFKRGGSEDKTSFDGGDNPDIFEVGTEKTLIPNNLYQ
ncbi:MAG: hypothetical protein C4278_01540 [Patescibacteria group bacterium]